MPSALERVKTTIIVSPIDKYGNPVKGQERVWIATDMCTEDAANQAIDETRKDIKKCMPRQPLFITRSGVSVNKR